ncbi:MULTISPECIES: pyridoxal 5'-phosphate synthase [Micromonospora]|uniref:Pyridoxamine 5'-phosphate oxidase n=1 Tax=Micromonospora solifontis TaxID=2487138 RepID=A0ABX9WFZ2_9ACTN|nr:MULTISPECIES: pyridoxal 5'-phosphate synthase [Micromonospora]NES16935.1 pyridoxamine 5'-phosphate oxidase [Micromonospora sp. PPF5-17B]NES38265.1 pyridoxamine 5'-phosphate oxidase [Micromonospora solifontis]NES58639.1 pyridoxamine 5'-phosphate oxidase [Micromonospora sp. PPF5-6]RNL96384.1 pyridoxamine 5'-phosphate oxidase [Micromonospora solifontis]
MTTRDLLRGLPVLAHEMPPFDPADAPDAPVPLFACWLAAAIDAGVDEPHAMTVSTVDADGAPDARVLILKDLDDEGWHFATTATSAKGRQLAGNPRIALSFHWREQGRQVRVRGTARTADPEVSRQDFLARPEGSRIATLPGRQSAVLTDRAELDRELAEVRTRLAADPGLVAEAHQVYSVTPATVEFWQADRERRHVRLRYRRAGDGWARELLWP